MAGAGRAQFLLLAGLASAMSVTATDVVDRHPTDDDLAEALAAVEAAGDPVPESYADQDPDRWTLERYELSLALRRSSGSQRRLRATFGLANGGFECRGRWQDSGDDRTLVAWLRGTVGRALSLGWGAGGVAHGQGLISGSVGRSPGLSAGSSLETASQGWRGTTSTSAQERLILGWSQGVVGPVGILLATGADENQRSVHATRLVWTWSSGQLATLVMNRDGRQATSVAYLGDAGMLRLQGEVARPAEHDLAAVMTATLRARRWRAGIQVGSSRVPDPLPGSRRPACLLGWWGRGWALQAGLRPSRGWRLDGLLAWSETRDPDPAPGDQRSRLRGEVMMKGTAASERWRWHARARLDLERQRSWQREEPWRPPLLENSPPAGWLAFGARGALAGGELRLDWRLRQRQDQARQVFFWQWRRDYAPWRLTVGSLAAWGDEVDLVTMQVPVVGYYVVQHWGRWRRGSWFGIEGRGRWAWHLALVTRQPAVVTGSAVWEGQVGLRLR